MLIKIRASLSKAYTHRVFQLDRIVYEKREPFVNPLFVPPHENVCELSNFLLSSDLILFLNIINYIYYVPCINTYK